MRRTRSVRSAALVTVAATLPSAAWSAGVAPDPASGLWRPGWAQVTQEDPKTDTMRILTHTREHCLELAHRVAELRARSRTPNAEANLLASEGEKLCAHGQIRPGIIRLRRAVLLLRDHAPPDPQGR